jgi:CHAT domain-containing protein
MQKQWRRQNLLWAVLLGISLSLGWAQTSRVWNAFGLAPQAVIAQTVAQTVAQTTAQTAAQTTRPNQPTLNQLEQQGRALYQNGQFAAAIVLWQQIAQAHASQHHDLAQASALSNLSLAHQQLGHWTAAQNAIAESLQLLTVAASDSTDSTQTDSTQTDSTQTDSTQTILNYWQVSGQVLTAQGSLQMSLGRPQAALETWQQAAEAYAHGDPIQVVDQLIRTQINQAQALRELGFYRQALEKLNGVLATLTEQPASPLKAIALQRLGEILRLSGQLSEAQSALTQSLAIAQQFHLATEASAALLSLGHSAQDTGDIAAAQDYYQQAITALNSPTAAQSVPLQLALLNLWVNSAQWPAANALWPTIQSQFASLPPGRHAFYYQINWANSLIKLKQQQPNNDAAPAWATLAQQLQQSVQQARSLQDINAEAHALGTLGTVYEQTQQWPEAQALTQQALRLSQSIDAADAYQWQWQLGRLKQAPSNPQRSLKESIAAYRQAIETLSHLRGDLVAQSDRAQFSFKENVEPIYRQLVGLLLDLENQLDHPQETLAIAQDVIESLHLAELDNYFKEACLDTQPINIDQVDQTAAIVYAIVLEDRLSVILRLPHQPLQQFATDILASEVSSVTTQLRRQLVIRSRRDYLPLAQQVYSWLIAPARDAIDHSGVSTIVFVLDGPLQKVPMAALHDGHHFLIEDYAVALTPGLKLLNPQVWHPSQLSVLISGLTESRLGRSPLPYVLKEVEKITKTIERHTVLLNQAFTRQALTDKIKSSLYPIVHIATHGQFSSSPEETYLVAWDERIHVREIAQILQANVGDRQPIEMLILSACETASGDHRAALGIAGVTIKAGAQSTLATLWAINDEATSQFVGHFYTQLTQPVTSRADALRTAQLQLLNNPQYQHPIYWAPYVLLGSWL